MLSQWSLPLSPSFSPHTHTLFLPPRKKQRKSILLCVCLKIIWVPPLSPRLPRSMSVPGLCQITFPGPASRVHLLPPPRPSQHLSQGCKAGVPGVKAETSPPFMQRKGLRVGVDAASSCLDSVRSLSPPIAGMSRSALPARRPAGLSAQAPAWGPHSHFDLCLLC